MSNFAQNNESGRVIVSSAEMRAGRPSFRRPSVTYLIHGSICAKERSNMLWTIFVVLLILWLLGFSLHVAGGLIHLLLVVALVILVINLVSGRRLA
jgi:hypothetical protein